MLDPYCMGESQLHEEGTSIASLSVPRSYPIRREWKRSWCHHWPSQTASTTAAHGCDYPQTMLPWCESTVEDGELRERDHWCGSISNIENNAAECCKHGHEHVSTDIRSKIAIQFLPSLSIYGKRFNSCMWIAPRCVPERKNQKTNIQMWSKHVWISMILITTWNS